MGQLDPTRQLGCELCLQDGGILLLRTDKFRVIRAEDADHPAFYRVIWNDHVAEWTDLVPADRSHLMQAVAKVETVLREVLQPTKVNLASLGNVVPHLHWHVIARYDWDARWPAPIWAPKQREVSDAEARLPVSLSQLDQAVVAAFRHPEMGLAD
ncbi:MAG TPA: HIT family protein [Aquabacterium sp.]|nr:HIT family protein [Aquabacterium sp.]